jgi:hypothetical protein
MRALRELEVLAPIVDRSWHHAVIDMMRPDGVKVAEMPQVNVLGPDDPPFVTMSRMTLHEVLEDRLRAFDVPRATGRDLEGAHRWRSDIYRRDDRRL